MLDLLQWAGSVCTRQHTVETVGPMPTVATRTELERLLVDDVPYGDLTTEALGIGSAAGTMEFAARDSMVLALAEDAAAMIELCSCRAELQAPSGTVVE
jgi:molybdenum transport protein